VEKTTGKNLAQALADRKADKARWKDPDSYDTRKDNPLGGEVVGFTPNRLGLVLAKAQPTNRFGVNILRQFLSLVPSYLIWSSQAL
jgi:hypothetical protein